mmetsp:Transcript_5505/g.23279  ORF Transcript_5505/g.23279 Transcript_5505/m.23279 type:complete len:261 (-) Transcript_5505:1091-1873(-)
MARGSTPAPAAEALSASACAADIFPSPASLLACSSAAARCGSLMVTPSIWLTPHTACTSAWLSSGLSGFCAPPPPRSRAPSPSSRPSSASDSPGLGVTRKRPHAQTTPAAPVLPIFFAAARLAASASSVWKLPELPSISVPLTPTAHSVCVSAVGSSFCGSRAARSRIMPSARGEGSSASSIASDHARFAHWYGVNVSSSLNATRHKASTVFLLAGTPPAAVRCHRAYAHSMFTTSGALNPSARSSARSPTAANSFERGS